MIVFQVTHECADPAYDDDDITEVKFIGVYSSRAAAEAAIERLRSKPGFSEVPDGFVVNAVQVDQTSWEDGYGTE